MSFGADFAALVPQPGRPVLVVRRTGCGCRLAAVHAGPAGFVLAGQRRALVETGAHRHVESVQFLQLLEQPDRPEDYGCRHATGMLPLDELLAAARDTTTTGRVFLV